VQSRIQCLSCQAEARRGPARREVERLERQVGNGAAPAVTEDSAEGVRFTAKGVRSHRACLGMSAADFGNLFGVTGHTVRRLREERGLPDAYQPPAQLLPERTLKIGLAHYLSIKSPLTGVADERTSAFL